jgi:uncharacterized protein (DUF433 family)
MSNLASTLPLHSESPPLRVDDGGSVRVGNSRVTLDVVVQQYENGMSPEELVRAYDSLALADVHAAIAYYLRHHDEVLAYLKQREAEAGAQRNTIEGERQRLSRDELHARRSAKTDAPAGK